jgi:hypothetical protein
MYGLKEAGIIAYRRLIKKLAPHGYNNATARIVAPYRTTDIPATCGR